MKTVCLTQANDKDFDANALGFDIKNMSNVKVYRVVKILDIIDEGHLHYVKLDFIEGDVSDPDADPMIVGTITKELSSEPSLLEKHQINNTHWRVMWNNKLWRPLDDTALDILTTFCGIKAESIQRLSDQLADNRARQTMIEGLFDMDLPPGWTRK